MRLLRRVGWLQFERRVFRLELDILLRQLGKFRVRLLVERFPVDVLERLRRERAEYEAGDEQISGDTLVGLGVVGEKSERSAWIYVR